MSTVTKEITVSCGTIWDPVAARVNWGEGTVQIGITGYDSQADLDIDKRCSRESVTVSSKGFDGTKEWCLTAMATDPKSKFKGGKVG